MRRLRPFLAVVLVGALGLGFWRWWQARPEGPPGWQGYVEADYVRIGPVLQGLLTERPVMRGDRVQAGDLLFAQDPVADTASRDEIAAKLAESKARLANLEAAARPPEIAQAEAQVEEQRALLARAQLDLRRAETLAPTGAVTRQALDQARADAAATAARLAQAEARLEQLRASLGRATEIAAQRAVVAQMHAQLAQAEWRLAQRRVVAPVAALVNEVYAWPGETVAAGSPVVSLLPPDNLLVRFFVPEEALPGLKTGTEVGITCDLCPPGLRGRISFVSPQAEYTPPVIFSEATRGKLIYLIEARPQDAPPGLLKPGQPVTLRLAP